MAQEIKVTMTISATKGNLTFERKFSGLAFDMSGTHSGQAVQDIGTTNEALVFPSDLATPGWAYFRNHDSTNYIDIGVRDGSANFIAFARLYPGECAIVAVATLLLYAKANVATAKLEFGLLER